MRRGVTIRTIINGLTFDGATKVPMQMAVRDALLAFMSAMSQAQAEATKDAQRAGIAHAKATEGNYLGRKPSFTSKQLATVRDMLACQSAIGAISDATGLSRQTIYRIQADPTWADALLARWASAA